MPTINIMTVGVGGVDMKSNPLFLGSKKLASATNGTFEEGIFRTRPGFDYHDIGVSGQFQGVCRFSPARGISAHAFAPDYSALVVAAGGQVWLTDTTGGFVACQSSALTDVIYKCLGEVNLFQAENYLIMQNKNANTHWWSSETGLVVSPGLAPDNFWEDPCVPKTEISDI